MTDEFWGNDKEMKESAIKLLQSIANSLKNIDSKLNPVIVEEEPENKPRFLGER